MATARFWHGLLQRGAELCDFETHPAHIWKRSATTWLETPGARLVATLADGGPSCIQ